MPILTDASSSQVDRNPPTYASGIAWWGTPYAARFDLKTNGQVREWGLIKKEKTAASARFHTLQTDAACAGANCDAFNFINVLDVDGSLTGGRTTPTESIALGPDGSLTLSPLPPTGSTVSGVPGSTVLGSNPLLGLSEITCPSQVAWSGATCRGVRFVNAFISDISTDAGHNALGPLSITRLTNPADNSTWRTTLSRATIDDMCA